MAGGVEERNAGRRFALIQGARISGVAVAVFGLVLLGRGDTLPDRLLGIALLLGGLLGSELVARAMARRWRTPKP